MDLHPAGGTASRPRPIQRIARIRAGAFSLVALAVGLGPAAIAAQSPGPSVAGQAPGSGPTLAGRLPASIGDAPVTLDFTDDLGSWIEAAFAGETGPAFDALDAALGDQGATRAGVRMAAASAADFEIQITGFQLPDGDAETLRDELVGVYFLGFEDLQSTEQDVDGQPVTVISQGPADEDAYPSAVLTDRDTVWIASTSADLLRPTVEAVVGAMRGTVARYDAGATPEPGYAAPWGWDGTVSLTTTWDQNSYAGTSSGTFTGSWVQPLDTTRYCDDDCIVYIPAGTIDWTWDVAAPTRPPCTASTRGTLKPGDVIHPTDQMLFLDPTDDGHVRYWGSGTFFIRDQPCVGWEAAKKPGSFMDLAMPDDTDPVADAANDPYPSCANQQWRITQDDTRITGRCWTYRGPGYEEVVEWDLVAVDG